MTALNTPITSDDEGDIRDAAGVYIAACWAGSMPVTRADAAANAAEIVRRVNLYDELVADPRDVADNQRVRCSQQSNLPARQVGGPLTCPATQSTSAPTSAGSATTPTTTT